MKRAKLEKVGEFLYELQMGKNFFIRQRSTDPIGKN